MPQRGFHCIVDFIDLPFEQCIGCAASQGRCQFTASLLRGMADQATARDQDPPTISVTALTGCVRQAYLQATRDYYRRPDEQYWAYRGSLAHEMVAHGAGEEVISEQRFARDLPLPSGRALTITGQPDEIAPVRRLLLEYKTAERPPRSPSPQHIAQLNAYRWLIAPDYEIATLGIVYLTMRGVSKVGIPIWPDGQTERFLVERAAALADALDGGPWPALTVDTWMCRSCPVQQACARGPADASEEPAPERDVA